MRANAALVVAVLVLAATGAKRPRQRAKLIYQWLDMRECPELLEQNLTTKLRYSKSGDVFADTEWNVVYGAQKLTKLRQILTKCREDGTECEHFMTWNSPMDGCSFVSAKNAVWSPCFVNIRPTFACPIQKGHYVNKNWTLDKDMLNTLPFPRNHVFKDRVEMYNEKDQLTFCIILEAIWRMVINRNDGQPPPPASAPSARSPAGS